MSMAEKKSKYFPNDWDEIKQTPDEGFEDHEFHEVIDKPWLLRPGYHAIIRAKSNKTGKVKEFAYKQFSSVSKKLETLQDDHELTLVTNEFAISSTNDGPELY